jgi:Domain of Unknown Function (DUF928)
MCLANFTLSPTLLSATLTGAVAIASGFYQSALATPSEGNLSDAAKVALSFQSPQDAAPASSIGGGIRGSIQFAAPDSGAPRSSIGGGVRGSLQFSTPGESAPKSSIGGGVRNGIQFSAPGDSAPRTSNSGGIRGDLQFQVPGDSAPRTSESGGIRGNDSPPLTALLPSTQNGRTVSSHPTFFVYLPPTESTQAFFSVQDEHGNPIYHTRLNISSSGGTIAIAMPEEAPELEVGKNYLWMFAPIEPNGVLRPDNYNVVGWVKRVEPATGNSDAMLSPLERATEYAHDGIWYDTLEVLASARLEQPKNATLSSEWRDLLIQVGLEKVATEPISQQF